MNKKMIKKITPFFSILALCIAHTSGASYKRVAAKPKTTKATTSARRVPTKKAVPARTPARRTPVAAPVVRPTSKTTAEKNRELLQNELQRTQQQLQNARAEIDQLRISSAVCEAAATLPEEVTRLTKEKAKLVAQIEQQERDLQETMAEMMANSEQLSAAQEQLAQKDRDIADGLSARQNRSDLEDQIMRQAIELAAKEEQLATLNAQIASLSAQIRSLRDENQERVASLSAQILSLQNENQKRAADLQQQISDLERKNSAAVLARRNLEQKLQRAQDDLDAQAEQHAASQAAIQETVTQQLETKYSNQIAQLEQQNAALTERNKELLARPSTGPSKTDFDQLKRNLATEKETVRRLEEEIKNKNKRIEAVEKSAREAQYKHEEEIRKLKQS